MKPLNEMKLTFLSKSSNESFARVAISAFVAPLDPTIDELSEIKTAVSEAVTNCIVHAYENQIGKITMTAKIVDYDRIVIKIADKGYGIEDIDKAMEPLYSSKPNNERTGLGFAVMQCFMDKVKVRSTPNKGTTITMEKYISPRTYKNGN